MEPVFLTMLTLYIYQKICRKTLTKKWGWNRLIPTQWREEKENLPLFIELETALDSGFSSCAKRLTTGDENPVQYDIMILRSKFLEI
jgi:hypothetical protein